MKDGSLIRRKTTCDCRRSGTGRPRPGSRRLQGVCQGEDFGIKISLHNQFQDPEKPLCKSHLYDKQISITELFNIHVYFNETRINSSRIIINWVAFAKQPASPRSEALRNGITFFDSSVVNTHYTVLTHCIVRELQNKRVMLKKRIAKCNSRIINLIETSIVTADLIFLNFSKEKCGPPHPCPFYKIVLSKVKCIK